MRRFLGTAALASVLFVPFAVLASVSSDLRYGAHGSDVVALQRFLIAEGYLQGQATGNFYSQTLAAVKTFQKARGLPATGFVGPQTRAAINAAPADDASGVRASSTLLADLQAKLAILLRQIKASQGTSTSVSSAAFDFDQSWRDSVVNILCMSRYGSIDDAVSGSGIIVDPRGIILTNAHMAQAFLFSDWPDPSLYQCSIRTGSPAAPQYTASLLYIPDAWIQADLKDAFKPDDLTVYGAHDYALLFITGTTSNSVQMPASFPYLPVYTGPALPVGTPAYLSGYAAEFLGGQQLQRSLYQLSSPASVYQDRSIADDTQPDVVAFSGNIASQHGSSGGAVIAQGGQLAGILTFLDKNPGYSTGDRILNAITTDYISRDLQNDTGFTLVRALAMPDPRASSEKFMANEGAQYQDAYAALWKSKGFNIPSLR